MRYIACFTIFACALTAAAQDAPKTQFTARELFYSATPAAKPAAAPSTPAPKPPATPAKKPAPPAPAPPPQVAHADTAPPPAAVLNGAQVIHASLVTAPAPASGTPLGLKYAILRKSGDEMVEVPPDTIFHSGDRIQLSVQTNGPGYLYIIAQGSSGTWQPMFPSSDLAGGDNRVNGWNASVLPPGSRMVFDEQVGTEKIFIVFSRTPEEGLEKMIYSLKGGAAPPAAAGEKAEAKPAGKKYLLSASAEIPDSTVGSLRETYTRDLIIEKVDDKTAADKSPTKSENAVYVVNPTGSADSRVVADLRLTHQ